MLQEITQAHPGAFCDDAGRYGSRNLRVWHWRCLPSTGVQDPIQGEGSAAGRTTKEAIRNALNHLSERSPEKLNGLRQTITFIVPSTSAVLVRLKGSYAPTFNPFFPPLERSYAR